MVNIGEVPNDLIDHPYVEELRLPMINGWHPHHYYFAAVAMPDGESSLYANLEVPTDEELKTLALFNQYLIESWGYRESYLQTMRERIVDMDPGRNTVIFGKSRKFGWQYLMLTWRHGPWPFFDPENPDEKKFPELHGILDHYLGEHQVQKWLDYQALHTQA